MVGNSDKWKIDYLYRMFSHRTRDKSAENYVVNAIWARLNDLRIKPVTQQYVRRTNGSYALIDLYFPQINYGIECDEAHHKSNVPRDAEREIDLQKVLTACSEEGLTIRRVDATLGAELLHDQINEIVSDIKEQIKRKGKSIPPWLSPEEEWINISNRGILRVKDNYAFKTIADICVKCFGKPDTYKIQRSYFKITDGYMLWCPKLAVDLPDGTKKAQSRGWVNDLSSDWQIIRESNSDKRKINLTAVHPDTPRITFAKSKTERGEDAYRFIGIFQWYETQQNGEYHLYKCTKDYIALN